MEPLSVTEESMRASLKAVWVNRVMESKVGDGGVSQEKLGPS